MSSKAKKPVQFPDSVDVLIQDNESIEVKGKKGELRLDLISEVAVSIHESSFNVQPTSNSKFSKMKKKSWFLTIKSELRLWF